MARLGLGLGLNRRNSKGKTPASILGNRLSLWLDPTFGRFQERAAQTTPANATNPIGTWIARTGQSYVAASDPARPTATQTARGITIVGNGTSQSLDGPAIDFTGFTKYTIYSVINPSAASTGGLGETWSIFGVDASGAGNVMFAPQLQEAGANRWLANAHNQPSSLAAIINTANAAADSWHLPIASMSADGVNVVATMRTKTRGLVSSSAASVLGLVNTATHVLDGSQTFDANYFRGGVGDIIVAKGTITAAEDAAILSYLNKWGTLL